MKRKMAFGQGPDWYVVLWIFFVHFVRMVVFVSWVVWP